MMGEVKGDALRNWVTGKVDPDTPEINIQTHSIMESHIGVGARVMCPNNFIGAIPNNWPSDDLFSLKLILADWCIFVG